MFVAKNQFYVLLACVAFGGVAGLLLSAINFFGYLTKQKILKFVCGVIALSIIGVLYSYYSYKLFFPNLRTYMLVGVLVGIYLYYKSFYIILAKILKKIYNIFKQKIKNIKGKKNDRNKSKKNDSGNDGGRSIVASNITLDNGLSNGFNKNRRKAHRTLERPN